MYSFFVDDFCVKAEPETELTETVKPYKGIVFHELLQPGKMYISGGSMGDIYGTLQIPDTEERVPIIVMAHGLGVTSADNMDYADDFTKAGYATFIFDFCGGSPRSKSDGTFEEMTVLTEAEDLNLILDYFCNDPRFTEVYLWGESQGGFVSGYTAGKRPEDIKKLVLYYPAFGLQNNTKKQMNSDGTFDDFVELWGSTLSRKFCEDALSFDIYDIIGNFKGPVLIVHGDKDGIVPIKWSHKAMNYYDNVRLKTIVGSDHGFGEDNRTKAKKYTIEFLQEDNYGIVDYTNVFE